MGGRVHRRYCAAPPPCMTGDIATIRAASRGIGADDNDGKGTLDRAEMAAYSQRSIGYARGVGLYGGGGHGGFSGCDRGRGC